MTNPIENLTADQRQLYELMSEISEDCYCAGWMVGNEYTLWSSIQTGEMRYGMSDIDRDLLAQVAALSVKTGCWIVWRDYEDGLPRNDSSTWGPYAIPLVEWNAIYEAKNDMRPERATQPVQEQVAAVRAVPEYHNPRDHSIPSGIQSAPSLQPEQSGSIDSDEFRKRLRGLRNYTLQESMDIELNEICESIDAWKDAACAVAYSKGYADMNTIAGDALILYSKRATDAEAKLAAIQSQAAGDVVNIRNKALENAASRVEDETCGCCWPEEVQDFAGHVAETILAMREQQP